MGINQAPPPQNVFKQIDIDSDNQLSKEEVQFFNQLAFFYFCLHFVWCGLFSLNIFKLIWEYLLVCLHASGFHFKVADYIKKHIPPTETSNDVAEEAPQQDPHKITEEIFQHEDHDRDGYISFDEFSGPKHDEL